jgi:hypothetical protein
MHNRTIFNNFTKASRICRPVGHNVKKCKLIRRSEVEDFKPLRARPVGKTVLPHLKNRASQSFPIYLCSSYSRPPILLNKKYNKCIRCIKLDSSPPLSSISCRLPSSYGRGRGCNNRILLLWPHDLLSPAPRSHPLPPLRGKYHKRQ